MFLTNSALIFPKTWRFKGFLRAQNFLQKLKTLFLGCKIHQHRLEQLVWICRRHIQGLTMSDNIGSSNVNPFPNKTFEEFDRF